MNGPYYEPGAYLCRVKEQAFQTSKTGRPMIVFKVNPLAMLSVSYGDSGEAEEQQEPTQQAYDRTVRLVIVEDNQESLDYAIAKLRFAGFTGQKFEELDLVGSTVRCNVKHEPYNGKLSEQWELALPPRDDQPMQSDGSLTRKLNALFGRRLTAAGAPPKAHPAPAPVAAGNYSDDGDPGIGDDDIPF